jgi:hypothetical protein
MSFSSDGQIVTRSVTRGRLVGRALHHMGNRLATDSHEEHTSYEVEPLANSQNKTSHPEMTHACL